MKRESSIWLIAALLLGATLLVCPAAHAEDFYKGKSFRFIVGFAPGGGYDTYTRLIARHFGKHVPGNPSTLVQNMTGAGSLISANYISRRAKPDGLTGAVFNNSLVVQRALGDTKVKVPFEKLEWVGAPSQGELVCLIMAYTGKTTWEAVRDSKEPIRMGTSRAGSTSYDIPLILNKVAGTNFEVITGYTGTATTRLAMEKGEVAGLCSQWESMRVTARSQLDAEGSQKLVPYVIHSRTYQDPELKGLPLFKDVIKSEEGLAIYNSWASQMDFQRSLALPPGTPKDRVKILREAYGKTLKDPKLLAEAKKAKIVITHVPGGDVEKLVSKIVNMPPDVKERLEFLIKRK